MDNEIIDKKFSQAIKQSYLTKKEFLAHLDQTLDSVCLGTGRTLLKQGQPQADIKSAKMNKFPHYSKTNEELSIRALKTNPDTWFIYVPSQSLAKPVSVKEFDNIMTATLKGKYYPYGLNMNRRIAKNEINQLV